jgi:arylsulfatase A-like enzyme
MDLFPTFVSLAGGKTDGVKRDGHDLTALLRGEKGATSPWEVFAYYELDQLQAVRSGPWKLFLPLESFAKHPQYRKGRGLQGPLLFNVVEDIDTSENVAADHPGVVARLTALAEAVKADLGDRDRPGAGQRRIGKIANPKPVTRDR